MEIDKVQDEDIIEFQTNLNDFRQNLMHKKVLLRLLKEWMKNDVKKKILLQEWITSIEEIRQLKSDDDNKQKFEEEICHLKTEIERLRAENEAEHIISNLDYVSNLPEIKIAENQEINQEIHDNDNINSWNENIMISNSEVDQFLTDNEQNNPETITANTTLENNQKIKLEQTKNKNFDSEIHEDENDKIGERKESDKFLKESNERPPQKIKISNKSSKLDKLQSMSKDELVNRLLCNIETGNLHLRKPNVRGKFRCKKCENCVNPHCGVCKACLDMKRFGGTGLLKIGCPKKPCLNSRKLKIEKNKSNYKKLGRNDRSGIHFDRLAKLYNCEKCDYSSDKRYHVMKHISLFHNK